MLALRICLFGGFRIGYDPPVSRKRIHRKTVELLSYLLIKRNRVHPREFLCDLIWGELDEQRARRCLNTTLWRLRNLVEPQGTPRGSYLTVTSRGENGFNCESDHWLDVEEFEAGIEPAISRASSTFNEREIAGLITGANLYKGDALANCYQDWALLERENLRSLYITAMIALMRHCKAQCSYSRAITWGRKVLEIEPVCEEVHRDLMRLHHGMGNRALALRQYEICRKFQNVELAIAPMEETKALYRAISSTEKNQAADLVRTTGESDA